MYHENSRVRSQYLPTAGEEENVDADEGDEHLVRRRIVGIYRPCNGDNVLTHEHAHSPEEEKWSSTPFLHEIQAWQCRTNIDHTSDDGNGESVADARIVEKGGPVVKDEIDPRQLLQTLEQAPSRQSFTHRTLDDVQIRCFTKAHLVLVICPDFCKFLNQSRVVDIKSSKPRERFGRFGMLANLDPISRSLR